MRAVIQRVSSARVVIDGERVAHLELPDGTQGLVALVGAARDDDDAAARALAAKIWRLRILDGDRSAADLAAPVLIVSQFTLYGDTRKGRRPSWNKAAPAAVAEPLVDTVADELRELGARVESGRFGAHMRLVMTNDGPVTVLAET